MSPVTRANLFGFFKVAPGDLATDSLYTAAT
jgi:hypothetical protein